MARNLAITQSYHEITAAFEEHLGGADRCWCGFAVWASKQAGRFIRREEVPRGLRGLLGIDPDRPWARWLRPSCWLSTPLARPLLTYASVTVEDVAGHVAEGNRLVYARLAPLFAELLEVAAVPGEPGQAARAALLARIAADPDLDAELQRAFELYLLGLAGGAASEREDKARAELVLTANLLVGLHEQRRLQEAIEGAIEAPIRRALADKRRRLGRLPIPLFVRRLVASGFAFVFGRLIRRFEAEWAATVTRCFMQLSTPRGALQLGDDVPPLASGELYPPALVALENAELRELVARLDFTPDTLAGSRAIDWTSLACRMHYVADYFRSRQREAELLETPFSPEQLADLDAGRIPAGRL